MKILVGKRFVATILILTLFFSTIVTFMSYNSRNNLVTAATTDSAFEAQIVGFPDSYKPYLRILHEEHPKWTFEPVNTGLKWADVINGENGANHYTRNLIPYNKMYLAASSSVFDVPSSWISTLAYKEDGSLDIASEPYWVQVSDDILKYFIDPRNYINDSYIFAFEQLAFNSSLNYNTILKSMLDNTFMDCDYATVGGSNGKTYAEVFIEVGKANNLSPIMLASRAIQEKGLGKIVNGKYVINDTLGSGVLKDGVTYYNFFNIKASGKSMEEIIANGVAEAKANGWTSQYKAIVGGGTFLKNDFYKIGQDTLYFQKFSVVNPQYLYWKQYMQNLVAPVNEGYKTMTAYSDAGILNSAYHFRIPVYLDMPSTAVSMPTTGYDSSYTLSGLTVKANNKSYSLEQTFNRTIMQYNVVVPKGTTSVNVTASKTSSGATVYINGSLIPSSGSATVSSSIAVVNGVNRIPIKVAGSKGTWTYFLNIYVSSDTTIKDINFLSGISLSKGSLSPSFNKTTLDYTANVDNAVSTLTFSVMPISGAWITIYYQDRTAANKHSDVTSITQDLCVGSNVFYVDVTSANGGLRSYIVTVNRADVTSPSKLTYSSTKYKITTTGSTGYINGFDVGTNVKSVLNNISIKNGTAKVVDSTGKDKSSTDVIATGDKIVLTGTTSGSVTLSALIYGDLNGDGKINLVDYAYMKASYWDKKSLTAMQELAGNIYSKTNGIDLFDLAYMKKFIWDSGTITQYR